MLEHLINDNEFYPIFQDMIGKVLEKEVEPYYEQWEHEGIMPRQLWNTLGEAGLLCVDLPEAYGGAETPFFFATLVQEEMAKRGYMALATSAVVHSDIVAPYVLNHGTEEQKQRWLPGMVSGEVVGAIAMTEPGAGSDLQGMKTTARDEGDCYVLNGSKTFITNGQHADLVVVAAKTDPTAGARGITLFLVDTTLPGFTKGRNLDKIGLHASDTSELFFEDLRVPKDCILGELGGGFKLLMDELPRERLSLAVVAVGASEGALGWTRDYIQERTAFGAPLAKLQNTRFAMADMKTDLELSRALVEKFVVKQINGELSAADASMAKLAATEMQGRITDGCLQLHGGYGYMTEYKISRAFTDARVQRIYGGASEIMKEIVARDLLGR